MKSRRFVGWLRYLLPIVGLFMTTHSLMAEPYVYTANLNGTVSVIDTAGDTYNKDTDTITLPANSRPKHICLNPVNSSAYTLNSGTNSVSVIDTVAKKEEASITSPLFNGLSGIACSPSGKHVYVTNSDPVTAAPTVYLIDTASNTVLSSSITVGSNPGGIVFNTDGSKAFVLNQGGPSISVIDTATLQVTGTIALSALDAPYALSIHAKSKYLYTANLLSNSVSLLDPVSLAETARINVGSFPYAIAASNLTNLFYAANNGNDTVSVADPETRTVTGTISISAPQALVERTDGMRLYVVSMLDNIIRSYDTQDLSKAPAEIALPPGSSPQAIATVLGTRHKLSVSVTGDGNGTVNSFIGPIDIAYPQATGDSASVPEGVEISVVAAAVGSTVSWTGCNTVSGEGATCKISPLTADKAVSAQFTLKRYNVTTSVSGGNGNISPISALSVGHGGIVNFTVTPNDGFYIASVSGCGGTWSGSNPYVISVTSDCEITASFALNQYTVTPSAGANGSISPNSAQKVGHGNTASFTLIPAVGYHIVTPVGGSCGGSLSGNTYTTSAITADCTVVANFAIDTFTVTFAPGANGSLTGTASQTLNYGASASQVSAIPAPGYHFVNWTGTGGFAASTANPLTVSNVTAAHDITANFVIDSFTVTFSPDAGGSLSGTASQTVNYGASAGAVSAIPAPGYHFVNWTGTGGFITSTANPLTVSNVTAAHDITANFAIDSFTVTFVAGANGTLSGTTSQTVNYGASAGAVSAIPAPGYHFVNWTGTGGFVTSTANPLTVSNVTAAHDITANFAIDSFMVTFSAGTGGSLSGIASQTVNYGASVGVVSAVPAPGYHFVNWTGTGGFVSTSNNPLTVANVTAAHDITANFSPNPVNGICGDDSGKTLAALSPINLCTTGTASSVSGAGHPWTWSCSGLNGGATDNTCSATIKSYSVSFAPPTNGTISDGTAQMVDYGASATAVTATTNPSYHFVNWTGTSGFVTTTTNPLTVANITADMTITANFSPNPVNGICGDDSGKTLAALSPINLCTTGTASSVSGAGHPWTWSCSGLNGGATDNTCSATIKSYSVSFALPTNGTISDGTTQTVDYGASATAVIANANSGYHFVNWTGTSGFVTTTANPLMVSNVIAAHDITANFAIDSFTVTFFPGANGIISGTSTQTVNYSASASQVTAVPAPGYHFVNWTGTGGFAPSTANPLTISNVTAAHDIAANFAIDSFRVTFSPGVGGSLSGTASQTVNYGASTSQVTAVPAPGYHFVNWTGTGGFAASTANPLTISNVTSNQDITANFAFNIYAVTPGAGANGSISPNAAQTVSYGNTTSFALTPAPGYSIASVSGCGGTLSGSTYTTAAITSTCSVNATFSPNQYTVTPSAGANGSISPSAPQTVSHGNSTSFTLIPNPGYSIVSVIGCGGTRSSSTYTTAAITGNCSISATFTLNSYNFTASVSGGNGTVVCISPVTYNSGSSCDITPTAGYHLATLNDNGVDVMGVVTNKNTYNAGNVIANHQITATFSAYVIGDALLALKAAIGLVVPTPADKVWQDVAPLDANSRPKGNGVVDIDDALTLLRRTVGRYNW